MLEEMEIVGQCPLVVLTEQFAADYTTFIKDSSKECVERRVLANSLHSLNRSTIGCKSGRSESSGIAVSGTAKNGVNMHVRAVRGRLDRRWL